MLYDEDIKGDNTVKKLFGARGGIGILSKVHISNKHTIQRIALVFLCSILVFTTAQPEIVAAAVLSNNKVFKINSQPLEANTKLNVAIATDSQTAPTVSNAPQTITSSAISQTRKVVKEDVSQRTAVSKTFINSDGSRTVEYSVIPQHYKKDRFKTS